MWPPFGQGRSNFKFVEPLQSKFVSEITRAPQDYGFLGFRITTLRFANGLQIARAARLRLKIWISHFTDWFSGRAHFGETRLSQEVQPPTWSWSREPPVVG